jgi:hypothetical protein
MTRPSRIAAPASLSESLYKQLNMYGLAATAAGVTFIALARPVEAKIVYTPTHKKVGFSTFIDLNHDGVNDFKLNLTRRQSCLGFCSTSGTTNASLAGKGLGKANQLYGQGKFASALPAGVRVGPKGKFPGGNLMAYVHASDEINEDVSGPWAGSGGGVQHRFLGLKFAIQGKTHFGWARLNVTIGRSATINATLSGYAYETIPNKTIITGQTKGSDDSDNFVEQPNPAALSVPTPEPATLGALAMGAPGLSIWKRKELECPA